MCNLLHAECVETVEVQCGDKLEELVASSPLSPYSDAGLQIAISVLTYGKYVYHSAANMQVFCHPDVTFLSYRKLMVVFCPGWSAHGQDTQTICKRPIINPLQIDIHVLVITRRRTPYTRYWHCMTSELEA